jgi:hypothetical protein
MGTVWFTIDYSRITALVELNLELTTGLTANQLPQLGNENEQITLY